MDFGPTFLQLCNGLTCITSFIENKNLDFAINLIKINGEVFKKLEINFKFWNSTIANKIVEKSKKWILWPDINNASFKYLVPKV